MLTWPKSACLQDVWQITSSLLKRFSFLGCSIF